MPPVCQGIPTSHNGLLWQCTEYGSVATCLCPAVALVIAPRLRRYSPQLSTQCQKPRSCKKTIPPRVSSAAPIERIRLSSHQPPSSPSPSPYQSSNPKFGKMTGRGLESRFERLSVADENENDIVASKTYSKAKVRLALSFSTTPSTRKANKLLSRLPRPFLSPLRAAAGTTCSRLLFRPRAPMPSHQ